MTGCCEQYLQMLLQNLLENQIMLGTENRNPKTIYLKNSPHFQKHKTLLSSEKLRRPPEFTFWYYRNGNSEALSFILWRAETHFKESLYFTTLDYLPGMKGWYWVIIIFNIFLRKLKYSEIFIVSFYINKIYLRTPSKVTFNESLKKGRGLNRKID